MIICHITGYPGSGKTTLDLNLRRICGTKAVGFFETSVFNNKKVMFAGPLIWTNQKRFLKTGGFDVVYHADRTRETIEKAGQEGVDILFLIGEGNLVEFIQPGGNKFIVLFNHRRKERCCRQKAGRKSGSAVAGRPEEEVYAYWAPKINAYFKAAGKYPNVVSRKLFGTTIQRLNTILEITGLGIQIPNDHELIRKAGKEHLKYFV